MKCGRCPAEIFYVKHERTGTSLPLNAQPNPKGNIELVTRADNVRVARVYAGANIEAARARGATLYLNHFADCPAAKSFRKT